MCETYIDTTKHRLGPIGVDMLTKHPRHPVSLGAEVHREQPAGLLDRARWIRLAVLEEVSLTRRPAYPGARVDLVIPTRMHPGRQHTPPLSAAGSTPRTLIRRGCGQVLAIR
jgi:hypothetical protein